MSIKTIRICEEADAKLMLKDRSFEGYIKMWLDCFPTLGEGALQRIKAIKEEHGIGLRNAKTLYDTLWYNDAVYFEIGNKIRIRYGRNAEIQIKERKGWRTEYSDWSPLPVMPMTITSHLSDILKTKRVY